MTASEQQACAISLREMQWGQTWSPEYRNEISRAPTHSCYQLLKPANLPKTPSPLISGLCQQGAANLDTPIFHDSAEWLIHASLMWPVM